MRISSLLIVDSFVRLKLFVGELIRLDEIAQVFKLLESRFLMVGIDMTQYLDDVVEQAVIVLVLRLVEQLFQVDGLGVLVRGHQPA